MVVKCVGLKGKPCLKKRIHGSGLSDDEFQMAKVLKKEVERVAGWYERAERIMDHRDDPRYRLGGALGSTISYEVLKGDVEYWRGQVNQTCTIARDIGYLFQEQDYYGPDDQRAFRIGAFLQATGCAD